MQVFISYDRQDEELADELANALREQGIDTWLDSDSPQSGGSWFQAIAEALRASSAMVVLVTPSALASPWVRRELEHAITHSSYRNRLVPLWLPGVDRSRAPTVLNIVQGLTLDRANLPATAEQVADMLRAAA